MRQFLLSVIFCTLNCLLFSQVALFEIGDSDLKIQQNGNVELSSSLKVGNHEGHTQAAGTIRWNGSDFQGWNGNEWMSFTAVGDPLASTGDDNSTDENAPHLIQPTSLSQGVIWNSVSSHTAHYADSGDAAIFWEDSGNWYLSTYQNGTWEHPSSASDFIPNYVSSDMNRHGKILFTTVDANSDHSTVFINEINGFEIVQLSGSITSSINNPNPKISLNDNGDYFVSFLHNSAGEISVFATNDLNTDPIKVSYEGSNSDQHLITYSENGEAVIFWTQTVDSEVEKGLFRCEFDGQSWQRSVFGLGDFIDRTFGIDPTNAINLNSLYSSTNGEFLLQYEKYDTEFRGASTYVSHHDIVEKRNNAWSSDNLLKSYFKNELNQYRNIKASMSDNGSSLYTYNQVDNVTSEVSNGKYVYDRTDNVWRMGAGVQGSQLFNVNDISNGEEIILSTFNYEGNEKLYLSFDAFNLSSLPNLNEGVGIEGGDAINGQVDVNNFGSYLMTWIQEGTLMFIVNE